MTNIWKGSELDMALFEWANHVYFKEIRIWKPNSANMGIGLDNSS